MLKVTGYICKVCGKAYSVVSVNAYWEYSYCSHKCMGKYEQRGWVNRYTTMLLDNLDATEREMLISVLTEAQTIDDAIEFIREIVLQYKEPGRG